ncbi:MAG: BatD family protein [Bacteroidota bacterium]
MKNLITIVLLSLTTSLWGQQEIRFYAELNHDSTIVDQPVEISFHIEGTDYRDFQLPDFGLFEVVGGPFQSTQIQYTDGKMTRKTSYSYLLLPKSSGIFLLEPASIMVGENKMETEPVRLIVTGETERIIAPTETSPPSKKKKKKKSKGKIYTI